MARVSIFIPTYNGEEFLAETLRSVLGQTCADIEVHCVDDGSTDATPEIARRFATIDARLHFYAKAHEGAVPHAWNYIFPYLKGEFTLYLSQDDILEPECISQLLDGVWGNDVDAVIASVVFFSDNFSHPESEYADINRRNDMSHHPEVTGAQAFAEMLDYSIPGFALWRTSVISAAGMPTEAFNSDEGMQRLWALQCRRITFSSAKFGYRQRKGSITKGLRPYHYTSLLTDTRLLETARAVPDAAPGLPAFQRHAYSSLLYLCAQYKVRHNTYTRQEDEQIAKIITQVWPSLSKGLAFGHDAKEFLLLLSSLSWQAFQFSAWLYSLKIRKE